MKLWSKFKALFARNRLEREMSDEMQAHLDGLTERNIAKGMSPEEARYAAQRAFGGVEQIKERARDVRGFILIQDLCQDVSHGFRLMRKHWLYSTFVIVIMAIGIGAVTSVASLINALAIRKLPVHEPDQLAQVSMLRRGFETFASYEHLRDNIQSASDVMAIGYPVTRGVRFAGGEANDAVLTEEVSGNFFTGLGVRAIHGRGLLPADDLPGDPGMVAVIGYNFWQSHCGGAKDAIGKSLIIGDTTLTVVGVMPREFTGVRMGFDTAIWLPLGLSPRIDGNQPWGIAANRGWLAIMARLSAGVTLSQAQTEFELQHQRALENEKTSLRNSKFNHQPIQIEPGNRGINYMWITLRPQLLVLLGMAGAALVIACANLSSLILVRSAARGGEVSTRMALGASRGRVMRQLAAESMMLIFIGSALGGLLAINGAQILAGNFAGSLVAAPDLKILGLTVLLMLVFGGACSLIPAWLSTNRSLTDGMKLRSGGSTTWKQKALSRGLVTAQIGLSFLLVSTAALLQQTLSNLQSVDAGFDSRNLLLFTLRSDSDANGPQQVDVYSQVLARVRQHPGVEGATLSGSGLFSRIQLSLDYAISDEAPTTDEKVKANVMTVEPSFFKTMRISMIAGDGFGQGDIPFSRENKQYRRVVITQAFAQRHYPNTDPIGRHFKLSGADVEIVGVGAGIPFSELKEKPGTRVEIYLNYAENPKHWPYPMMFEVRSRRLDDSLPADIRNIVNEISPTATISDMISMDDRLEQLTMHERSNAQISMFIGSFAFLLAGLGLFGLISFSTQMQTKEIGIRMALGADTSRVVWGVVRPAFLMSLTGVAVGFIGYLGVSKSLANQLYQAEPASPIILGSTLLAMMGVIAIACWIPARLAAKVDPMEALRCE